MRDVRAALSFLRGAILSALPSSEGELLALMH
jgi:hypothetical protein